MCNDDKSSTAVGSPDYRQALVFVHLDRCFCQNLDLKAEYLLAGAIPIMKRSAGRH
jgi:hypothetical protein